MLPAGPFEAELKCCGHVFWKEGGLSSFSGPLQLITVHLITLYNILKYANCHHKKNEPEDFVYTDISVILKTFGHDCVTSSLPAWVDVHEHL